MTRVARAALKGSVAAKLRPGGRRLLLTLPVLG
jgi:hypothetical protein